MLFLLALPIFLAVAAAHRYLTLYAPSNILIRHVRMSPPRWRTVGALAVLTGLLIVAMRAAEVAITAGSPDWLNLIALILAWDALKLCAVALLVVIRRISGAIRSRLREASGNRSSSNPTGVQCQIAWGPQSSGPASSRRSWLADFRRTGTRKTTEDVW